MDQLLSHWLKIRPDERRRTALLFLFLFFSTSFIIIGRTARDALLLSSVGISLLPYMYVGIAIGSSATALLYSHLMGRTSPYPILRLTLVVSVVVLIILRLGMGDHDVWVISALYLFMEVAGSMLAVLFWTFANEAFSTREAKRLFGVIGSGGVMAGTVCGFGGAWLAPLLGTENLLFVCVGALLVCLGLAGSVHRLQNPASPPVRAGQAPPVEVGVSPRYLFSLGLLAVLMSVAVNIIDFEFKAVVRTRYSGDQLASFFGVLYGVCGLLSFFSHLFFTSRLLTRRGILPALLILPGTLLLGTFGLLVAPGLSAAVFLKSADATLRYSLNDTCMQLLYLPLPVVQRRKVKATLEGAVKPLAIAGTGGLLLLLGQDDGARRLLTYCLLVALLGWIVLALLLRRGYVSALIQSLNRRGGLDDEFPVTLSDVASTQALVEALRSGDDGIVLGALEILPVQQGELWSVHVLPLLLAPERSVRLAAHHFCLREGIPMPVSTREQWLVDLDDGLRAAAVDVLAGGYGAEHFLVDPAPEVRARAIVGLVKRAVDASSREALEVLEEMRLSPDAQTRVQAAWAMGELGGPEEGLRRLIQDSEVDVRHEAIEAAGKAQILGLVPQLLDLLANSQLGDEAANALSKYGEVVLSQLLALVPDLGDDELYRTHVFSALRGIGTRRVAEELVRRLPADRALRHEMLLLTFSLVRPRAEGPLRLEQLRAPLLVEIQDCYQWWSVLGALGRAPEWELLRSAIDEERRLARERALLLLAHVYPVRPIQTLSDALVSSATPQLSNALEVLDEIIEPELRVLLMPLLEPVALEAQSRQGEAFFSLVTLSAVEWCRYFLRGEDRWLAVCVLAAVKPLNLVTLVPDIRLLLDHEDLTLREAAYACLYALLGESERPLLLERAQFETHAPLRRLVRGWLDGQESMMISSVDKVLFLKRVDLFSQLPGRELLNLAAIAEQVSFAEQSVIFEEGSEGDSLYLILSGQVRVSRAGRHIATLGMRECFGEMAILDRTPRSATVTAMDRVSALRIERDSFYDLLAQKREIALGIIRILVARLRDANER